MIANIEFNHGGVKLCCHCEHYLPAKVHRDGDAQVSFARCGAGERVVDLVGGDRNFPYCSVERCEGNTCGPEGKNFKLAEPEIVP